MIEKPTAANLADLWPLAKMAAENGSEQASEGPEAAPPENILLRERHGLPAEPKQSMMAG
jgi:hypothetical protein